MADQHLDRDTLKQKHPPLIVVMGFDPDDESELQPAFKPIGKQPDFGEFGDPVVICGHGQVPEME